MVFPYGGCRVPWFLRGDWWLPESMFWEKPAKASWGFLIWLWNLGSFIAIMSYSRGNHMGPFKFKGSMHGLCLKAWLGLDDLLLGWLTHWVVGGYSVSFPGCWEEASVPCHMDVSTGFLNCSVYLTPNCPSSSWSMREWGGSCNVLYGLVLEVTHHPVHLILLEINH